MQIPPGTTITTYRINVGGEAAGWYVVVAGQNVTVGSYTWVANRAYWIFSATPFPDAFAVSWWGTNPPATLDPATADLTTTTGPFDTSRTVVPVSANRWWSLTLSGGGSIGAMGMTGGTQYWYELSPNDYIQIPSGQSLHFASSAPATTAMYQTIDTPV